MGVEKRTSITTLDVKPRNLLPNFCSLTIVNGNGFLVLHLHSYSDVNIYHFFVVFDSTAVTVAVLACRHLSNKISVIM